MKKILTIIIAVTMTFCAFAWDFELDSNKDGKPDRFMNAEADKNGKLTT